MQAHTKWSILGFFALIGVTAVWGVALLIAYDEFSYLSFVLPYADALWVVALLLPTLLFGAFDLYKRLKQRAEPPIGLAARLLQRQYGYYFLPFVMCIPMWLWAAALLVLPGYTAYEAIKRSQMVNSSTAATAAALAAALGVAPVAVPVELSLPKTISINNHSGMDITAVTFSTSLADDASVLKATLESGVIKANEKQELALPAPLKLCKPNIAIETRDGTSTTYGEVPLCSFNKLTLSLTEDKRYSLSVQ